MENDNLRWAPPEEVVKLAEESGMTTAEIVRVVSACLPYREALKVAREYAPLLKISVPDFMEMRKNK